MVDERLPGVIADRYRPVRVIGKGGMGTVYEVEHLHTGQRLALKVLDERREALLARFKREARALSQITSEHVVRVADAGIASDLGGAPFLVLELLRGTDLERAAGDKAVPAEQAVAWLRQVAIGLDDIHRAGIVHRDLKPANLFLVLRDGAPPLVKILDFGVSKLLADTSALTGSNEFLGSPIYMAPEQTDGREAAITLRTDLYALGLVTYRLLVGRGYWRPGTLSQVFAQLLIEPMVPPSQREAHLGPVFDAWFLQACHRQPKQRFSSAGEQIERLAEALGIAPAPALAATAWTATPSVTTRLTQKTTRWVLIGAAAVLAVTAAIGGVLRGKRATAQTSLAAAPRDPGGASDSADPSARAPEPRADAPLGAPPTERAPRTKSGAGKARRIIDRRRPEISAARDPLDGQF